MKQVLLDFEKAVWLAMRSVLPNVQLKGCAFHWTQALWRKVSHRHPNSDLERLDAGDHTTSNYTAWLVTAGSLDQEMLVPDVTLIVIKPF